MKSAKSIIEHAEGLLETAKNGWHDMTNVPGRARSGLQAAVMAGRSVTFALQNLKSVDAAFEPWWEGKRSEMKANRLLAYVSDLRTKIEKQATNETISYAFVRNISGGVNPTTEAPPKGAVAFFSGDATGGSGWIVQEPDGRTRKHYVNPKQPHFQSGLKLSPAGETGLLGVDAEQVIGEYIKYIEELLREARERFL